MTESIHRLLAASVSIEKRDTPSVGRGGRPRDRQQQRPESETQRRDSFRARHVHGWKRARCCPRGQWTRSTRRLSTRFRLTARADRCRRSLNRRRSRDRRVFAQFSNRCHISFSRACHASRSAKSAWKRDATKGHRWVEYFSIGAVPRRGAWWSCNHRLSRRRRRMKLGYTVCRCMTGKVVSVTSDPGRNPRAKQVDRGLRWVGRESDRVNKRRGMIEDWQRWGMKPESGVEPLIVTLKHYITGAQRCKIIAASVSARGR